MTCFKFPCEVLSCLSTSITVGRVLRGNRRRPRCFQVLTRLCGRSSENRVVSVPTRSLLCRLQGRVLRTARRPHASRASIHQIPVSLRRLEPRSESQSLQLVKSTQRPMQAGSRLLCFGQLLAADWPLQSVIEGLTALRIVADCVAETAAKPRSLHLQLLASHVSLMSEGH